MPEKITQPEGRQRIRLPGRFSAEGAYVITPQKAPQCPHCGIKMKKWRVPIASTWPDEFFYVCLNDDCPYYVKGWDLMWEQQATRASYRCRLDPDTGKFVPLPVWSADALKDDIIEG